MTGCQTLPLVGLVVPASRVQPDGREVSLAELVNTAQSNSQAITCGFAAGLTRLVGTTRPTKDTLCRSEFWKQLVNDGPCGECWKLMS